MKKEVNLCQFEKYGCFGCCGHSFKTREEIEADLKKNTKLLKEKGIKVFSEQGVELHDSGICNKLVLVNGKTFCGAHPMQNSGIDYRDSECQKEYFCKTVKWFSNLNEKEQEKFLSFLRKKDLDWWDYSLGLDTGSLMKEFLKEEDN